MLRASLGSGGEGRIQQRIKTVLSRFTKKGYRHGPETLGKVQALDKENSFLSISKAES